MALDILIWIKDNGYSVNDLKFELLNREERKSGYTYVINNNKVNIQSIENHLIDNSLLIQFVNKSNTNKQYLTVYKYDK